MKRVLLTGDSKGVGLAIKNKLIDSGYDVIGISRNSIDIKYLYHLLKSFLITSLMSQKNIIILYGKMKLINTGQKR